MIMTDTLLTFSQLDPIIRPRATAKKQKTRAVSELSPSVDNFLMISDAESDAGEDFVDDSDPDSHSTRMFYDEEDRNVSRSNEADFDERDDTVFTCDTPMDPTTMVATNHHRPLTIYRVLEPRASQIDQNVSAVRLTPTQATQI